MLPTTDVVQGNLGLPLLPNSPELHQNNKIKSYADPCVLISLGNTMNENNKVLEQPWRHFTSLKLSHCYKIPQPSHRVTSTSNRIKTITMA